MWEMIEDGSWFSKNDTLVFVRVDNDISMSWFRKKNSNSEYPVHMTTIQKINKWNVFKRIKKMFCRAFEC
jgi:hypothetical protein